MNAPTSVPVADDTSLPVKSALEEFPAQIENDTERTKSSLARLTSNSVDRLERLMSEIQEMREFLISEGERVQREIANYAQLNQTSHWPLPRSNPRRLARGRAPQSLARHILARSNFLTGARGSSGGPSGGHISEAQRMFQELLIAFSNRRAQSLESNDTATKIGNLEWAVQSILEKLRDLENEKRLGN